MILPDVILYQTDNQKLREFVLNNYHLRRILNLGNVFEKVTRPSCVVIFETGKSNDKAIKTADFSKLRKPEKILEMASGSSLVSVEQPALQAVPGSLFLTANADHYSIWRTVKSSKHYELSELVDKDGIQRGVSPDLKDAFLVSSKMAKDAGLERSVLRRVLTGGKHVKRYAIEYPDILLIYTQRETNFHELPKVRAYIDRFKDRITCKEVAQKKHSLYALHRARDEAIFLKKQKLVGVITEDEIVVALDDKQTYATDGLYLFGVRADIDVHYLMGILNSRLFVFIYRLLTLESGRVMAQVKPTVLAQLPIRKIDCKNRQDVTQQDQLVKLVKQRMDLHIQEGSAKTPQEQKAVDRLIEANDARINELIYKLYNLSAQEIEIVEANT